MPFKEIGATEASDFLLAIKGRNIWICYIGKKRQNCTIEFVAENEMGHRLSPGDPLIRRFTAGSKRVNIRIPSAVETKLPAWAKIYNNATDECIAGIRITAQ